MPVRRILIALILCCVAFAAQADGVDDLEAFYRDVHSLSATFSQQQQDEDGNTLQQARGTFELSRPDKFRWAYTEPYKQVIVSDGDVFRFYDVGLAQVTVRPIDTTLRATPALLLTGGAALEDAFNITSAGKRDGMSWVKLTPRADDSDFRQVRLGLKDQVPSVMELDDKLGQTTRIRFDNVELNPTIANDRFTLDVPDDVEVVDGRAANGGGQ